MTPTERTAWAKRLDEIAKRRFGSCARVSCTRGRKGRGRPQVCEFSVAGCLIGRPDEVERISVGAVIEAVEDCVERSRDRAKVELERVSVFNAALAELRARHGG